jgi:hypothetical protein
MSSNNNYYQVIQRIDGVTHIVSLQKEQAESLYRKLRTSGSGVDITKTKILKESLDDKK